MRGVTTMTVRDGVVAARRLSIVPTEIGGSEIDTTMRNLTEPLGSN
jgi:hypothetical protein